MSTAQILATPTSDPDEIADGGGAILVATRLPEVSRGISSRLLTAGHLLTTTRNLVRGWGLGKEVPVGLAGGTRRRDGDQNW